MHLRKISHTPKEARKRWSEDSYHYPPYTYKAEYCLTDEVTLRVCGASERESLMGFRQGHTAVKVAGRMADQDIRCAAVGNSFHTGVVTLLHMAILSQLPGACLPGVAEVLRKHWRELATQPKRSSAPNRRNIFHLPGMKNWKCWSNSLRPARL